MVKRRTLQISSLAVGKRSVAAEGIVIDREEELVGVKGRKKADFFFLGSLPRGNRIMQCSSRC